MVKDPETREVNAPKVAQPLWTESVSFTALWLPFLAHMTIGVFSV